MGGGPNFFYAPNTKIVEDTVATTTWHMLDINGADNGSTGAGPWPNLDMGMFLQTLAVRSLNSSLTGDGSMFAYAFNQPAGFSGPGEYVSGSGQTPITPPGQLHNIWIKKTVSTDIIQLVGRF